MNEKEKLDKEMGAFENTMNDTLDQRFNTWDLESTRSGTVITWKFKIPGEGEFIMTLTKNNDNGTPDSQRPGGEDYED